MHMCGGLVCSEGFPRAWARGAQEASRRELTRVEKSSVGRVVRIWGWGDALRLHVVQTLSLLNLREGCVEVRPLFSPPSCPLDTFHH